MRKKNVIFFTVLLFFIVSCNNSKEEKVFDEKNPFAVEIKKERSFYQADKIRNRLNEMGLTAYILKEQQDDGEWYRIVSGALENEDSVAVYKQKIKNLFGITVADTILDFTKMDSAMRIPVKAEQVSERKRIEANTPDVPLNISKVLKMFPQNNMFYLKNINILSLKGKGLKSAEGQKLDLPRGVSLQYLKNKGCESFSSVIYEDNLFGDQTTIQIVGRTGYKNVSTNNAALLAFNTKVYNQEAVDFCMEIAEKILATGTYIDEKAESVEFEAYKSLLGYKVSFATKGKIRTYYILTDSDGEYLFMAQSTKDNNEELESILRNIGNSDGLNSYDEFYNTFYTIAEKQKDNEEFLGYYMSRLTNSYAKSKGYKKWAKKMVGMWCADYIFYNSKKGMWTYSIFDLLTDKNRQYVYDDLYMSGASKNDLRKVYGEEGRVVYTNYYFYKNIEVNFGINRYVVAIDSDDYYTEKDLIERAESLQFLKGGYKPNSEIDSTTLL